MNAVSPAKSWVGGRKRGIASLATGKATTLSVPTATVTFALNVAIRATTARCPRCAMKNNLEDFIHYVAIGFCVGVIIFTLISLL